MSDDGARLREALKRAAVALKTAKVPFALAGGYAAWARGGPEPGHDVDFFLTQDDIPNALAALKEAGFRAEDPPEDWLAKVYYDDQLVDLIHHPAERPVTPDLLERASDCNVDAVLMPVLSATDVIATRLLAMDEHYCDFGMNLPTVRALREQVDWADVRGRCAESPFARAFLFLVEELGIVGRAGTDEGDAASREPAA